MTSARGKRLPGCTLGLLTMESIDADALSIPERDVLHDIVDGSTRAACLVESRRYGNLKFHPGCEMEYRQVMKAGKQLAKLFGIEFPES